MEQLMGSAEGSSPKRKPGYDLTLTHSPRERGQNGQSLVEFALCAPVFFFILLVAIQLGLIMVQYYSLVRVTQETTRWLAIRPNTTDADVLTHVRAGPITLDPNRFVAVAASPGCPSLVDGLCSARSSGDILSVQITYDMSNLMVLPRDFRLGDMSIQLPLNLPPYRAAAMIE